MGERAVKGNHASISRIPIVRLARRIPPFAGGQEQHVARIAEEQSAAGATNLLAFSQGSAENNSTYKWFKLPNVGGVPTDLGKGILFSSLAAVCLQRFRKTHQPRVFHSHGTAGDILAPLILKSRDVLAFHTFHGGLPRRPHTKQFFKTVLARLDGVVVVSDLIREDLRNLKADLPPVYTVSSAVDPVLFAVKPIRGANRALMVGRLVPVKGFDIGIRASAILYRRGIIAKLDIAGSGPEEARLRRVAEQERLPVEFHGHLDKTTLAALFANAAVMICPSRTMPAQAEGTPTTILEAWAAGIPVVASASGGITVLVKDGVDGILVPEGDPEHLAKGVAVAMTRRQSLIEEGHRRVKGYTWKRAANRLLQIYREHGADL